MKTAITFCLIAAAMILDGLSARAGQSQQIALVPQPLHMVRTPGAFAVTKDTKILVEKDSTDAANVGRQLAWRINRSTGFALTVSPGEPTAAAGNVIRLTINSANVALGAESYTLKAGPEGVVISAGDGPGLFYGVQTLLQLLPPQVFSAAGSGKAAAWQVPAVSIEDKPRFRWRGLLLDVSSHFFKKDEIKNYIDLLAQHKLNVFHWHLTDDPGWRVEIKRYPKLTEIGAWRKQVLFGLNPKDETEWAPDGRYGGFYTQDDIREIVAYAKDRYVTILPEIDMPGHLGGALAAYPEYTCTGKYDGPSEEMAVCCVGNEGSFEFLEAILTEVLELFPSKYVHIGGDEVEKHHWAKCEKCQARMRKEGLKDVNELQSYFIRRVEKFLNARHRNLIGWDEILDGGLAPNATVMTWRGVKGGIDAANAGHDVIMTPTSHCYLDYCQAKSGEPKSIDGFLPLATVYSFEPIPTELAADKVKHILGAGGNLWTEFVPNWRHAQYMAYPRTCAVAEVTWTDPRQKNWEDFQKRLNRHLERLKAQGVNYRQPRATDDQPAKKRPWKKPSQ